MMSLDCDCASAMTFSAAIAAYSRPVGIKPGNFGSKSNHNDVHSLNTNTEDNPTSDHCMS